MAPTPEPNAATLVNGTNTPGDANNAFIISEDGDNRIGGNISIADGRTAIKITANRVRLQLGGFAINGVAEPETNGDGIVVDADDPGVATFTVENGVIKGFANGINVVNLPNNLASHFIAKDVQTVGNDQNSILTQHNSDRLFNVNANGNGGFGVNGNAATSVSGCRAHLNGEDGIKAGVVRRRVTRPEGRA